MFNKVFPACETVSHYAKRRSHNAVVRVYDGTGNVIETHKAISKSGKAYHLSSTRENVSLNLTASDICTNFERS